MRQWLVWDNHMNYEEWNFQAKACILAYGKEANIDAPKSFFDEMNEPIIGAIEIARANGWHACRKRMEADLDYKVESKNDP